jgi:hypothetical protein
MEYETSARPHCMIRSLGAMITFENDNWLHLAS